MTKFGITNMMKLRTEQKIWVTSDTHFNHKNIIAYENRPFPSVPDMNNELIKRWNSVVGPDDIVIHLGDFALGPTADLDWLIPSLNGHKILVLGNHDHASQQRFLNAGFEAVQKYWLLQDAERIILCTHRPQDGAKLPHHLHLYGHVHSKDFNGTFPTIAQNGACVCVERWDYTPILMDRVVDLCLASAITAPEVA